MTAKKSPLSALSGNDLREMLYAVFASEAMKLLGLDHDVADLLRTAFQQDTLLSKYPSELDALVRILDPSHPPACGPVHPRSRRTSHRRFQPRRRPASYEGSVSTLINVFRAPLGDFADDPVNQRSEAFPNA